MDNLFFTAIANLLEEEESQESNVFSLLFEPTADNKEIGVVFGLIHNPLYQIYGSYSIDWGDGSSIETYSTNGSGNNSTTLNITATHTYALSGSYTIEITAVNCASFKINNNANVKFFTECNYNWKALGRSLTSLNSCFLNCTGLTSVCTTLPANVTNVASMFQGATSVFVDLNSLAENAPTNGYQITTLAYFTTPGVSAYGNWVPFLRKCPNLNTAFINHVAYYKNEHAIGNYGKALEISITITNANTRWGLKPMVLDNINAYAWFAVDWGDGNEELFSSLNFFNKWADHCYKTPGNYTVQCHGFHIAELICDYATSVSHINDADSGLSNVKVLPAGVTRLDYIESTGDQYIDTGFNPTNKTEIDLLFVKDSEDPDTILYSASDGTNNILFKYAANNLFNIKFGKSSTTTSSEKYTEVKLYSRLNKTSMRFLGVTVQNNYQNAVFTVNSPLILLDANNNDIVRIYDCIIKDNNVLIRNFVPVLYNNVPCLYDTCTQEFFYGNSETNFNYAVESYFSFTVEIGTAEQNNYAPTKINQFFIIRTSGTGVIPGTVPLRVDWGDGVSNYVDYDSAQNGKYTHTYTDAGVYEVKIRGNVGNLRASDAKNYIPITMNNNWTELGYITSLNSLFYYCMRVYLNTNLVIPKYTTTLSQAFYYCQNFVGENINLDLSKYKYITSLELTFSRNYKLSGIIKELPPALQTFNGAFEGCSKCQIQIHSLPVNVLYAQGTFGGASLTEIDLDEWVENLGDQTWSKMVNINGMFRNCPLVTGSRSNFLSKMKSSVVHAYDPFYGTNTTE